MRMMRIGIVLACLLGVTVGWGQTEEPVIPPQVRLTVQFVRFDATNITCAALAKGGNDLIMKLWTNGCGQLIAAPTTTTRSGSECMVKGVSEYIYPTWFNVETNRDSQSTVETTVIPEDFATREVGAIVQVLPEVSPSGDEVNVTIKPQFVESPFWKDYGLDLPMGTNTNATYHLPIKQPIFHVYQCETSITVKDGESVIIFGGNPSRDGKTYLYCFLTVQLVKADAKPARKARE